jgi:hypothetical protein
VDYLMRRLARAPGNLLAFPQVLDRENCIVRKAPRIP